MVELGFSLNKGFGFDSGLDTRSVIKNATKDVNMENKDKTIMNKEEINNKLINNTVKPKVQPLGNEGNKQVDNKSGINVSQSKIGGNFGNNILSNNLIGGINNIKKDEENIVKNENGEVKKANNIKVNGLGYDIDGAINGFEMGAGTGIEALKTTPEKLKATKEKIDLRKQQTAEALPYIGEFQNSIKESILNGEDDRLTIENIRKAFPEFNGFDDKQLGDLTQDIYNSIKLDKDFNLYSYALKHPELYIEFEDSDQLGNVGRADYLDAMFRASDADSKPGLLSFLTLGLAPSKLGVLNTKSLSDTEYGEEGKTWANNAWKSLWNAVALTYNFINHPAESMKMLGGSILGMGADYALKKTAKKEGMSKDEFVQSLINNMGDGSSFYDKVTKLLINGGEMGSMLKDYFKTNYGSAEGFANYIYEDPAGVISDIISLAELGVGLAGKAGVIEGSVAKSTLKQLSWLDPYEVAAKPLLGWETKAGKKVSGIIPAVAKGEYKAVKGITKGVAKGIRKGTSNLVEFVLNKATGLDKEARAFIKENPDVAMKYIKGEESVGDIAERIVNKFNELESERKLEGEKYNFIKNNSKAVVKIGDAINNIKNVFGELGIKIENGKLSFGDISYSEPQKRALQNVYNYVNTLSKRGDVATVSDVWRTRQLIDNAINWEGNSKVGLDAEVMNMVKNMRSKVDDVLKEQVGGFKDIDNRYGTIVREIKELRKDWFTKEGNLKDNALSKIRNLTNKGNEKKLERLEKYIPGIKDDAKALGVAEAVDKATKQNVGQYFQQNWLVGGGLGALAGMSFGVKGVIAALGMMGVLTPKNFVRVLARMGKGAEYLKGSKVGKGVAKIGEGIDWIKNVGDRIVKGEKLTDNQIEAVQKLMDEKYDEFMNDPKKYVDYEYDRAQKSAYLEHESKEGKLLEEEIKKLDKKYEKKMKDIGFVRDVENGILENNEGYSLLKEKLYNWRENAGDTTRQHEFFHSVFSVVDDKTYKYVLDEAKKYLNVDENKLGSKANEVAEEWLAESFGVYIRRKEIKAGEIRLKGNRLERFNSKVRDLFQRAYEWIQGYIVDRKTIDKLFDEVYGGVKLDDDGKVDLAEKLGINKEKLGGVSEGKGLRYKKAGKSDNFEYNTTNGGADRLLLGNSSTTEGGMRKATHVEGGRANRGAQKAYLGKVSSSDTANFFELKDKKGKGYIEYNSGGGKIERVYKKHDLFNGYSEKLNKGLKGYKENLVKINEELAQNSSKKTSEKIGKTKHGKDITISKEGLSHIYKHGNLDFNTLINAVNDPTNQKQEFMGGRYRFETKLDDGDTLVVGLQPKKKMKNGKVMDVNSRVDADLYSITSVTKGKPRGAESLEVRLKKTYHGSSADFKKFDSSHMGEGEGAQAHGWGHYVAVDRNTAKDYAEMKGADFEYKGKKLNGEINYREQSVEDRVANQIYGELKDGKKWDKAIENIKRYTEGWIRDYKRKAENAESKGMREYYKEAMKDEIDGLKMLDNMKEEDFVNKGGRNLYNVEIPDPVKRDTPTGSNYIEEDKNYTKKEVEDIIDKAKKYREDDWRKDVGYDIEESPFHKNLMDGSYRDFKERMLKENNVDGRDLYKGLAKYLGGQKQASKFLESLGYDGIHYFGGRDGEAYVIFGDKNMDITNHIRYKKGVNDRNYMKDLLIERDEKGVYKNLKKDLDGFLDNVSEKNGAYSVKAPLKYGSNGVDFSVEGKKGNRILDKGEKKAGGLDEVNDIARGTIRVSSIGDIYKVVDYVKKNYKNVIDFDDKYSSPTPMGYVDYSFLYEGKDGLKAEVQVNVTEMIVAKEVLKDALNYGISEKEYNDIVKRSGTKGGGLGHTFYDEIKLIDNRIKEGGLSDKEKEKLRLKIRELNNESRKYYKSYMDLIKG